MIKLIDGVIKSLQTISRHLEYSNDSGYKYVDSYYGMIRTERDQRACGNRPAIISEDTGPMLDDIERGYKGEKGKDYYRGAV